MESLRRLTSSIFDGESRRLSLGRRGSISSGILSPNSEAAAVAAQRFAPSELDLTFITDRLVVMGFPVEGPTDKKRNQNNIDDLAEYLESNHSNQYLIFNLNSLEEDPVVHVQGLDSFISSAATPTTAAGNKKALNVIADKVRQQMVEFAWERDGMKAHTPPIDHVFRICYAIFAWLSVDAKNIALINCQTGKTRSGIVVASYLLYARLVDDPINAFVEFYRKRWDMKSLTPDALRQKTPQSVQRFLTCFHELVENQRIPNEKPLLLKGIIIRCVPVEYQPCIQIWDDYRLLYCTSDGPQHVQGNDSPQGNEGPVIDWDCEDGCLAILWEDGLDLDGGFSIMCSFGDEYDIDESTVDPSTKVLFRYAESTWFLSPGLITLTKSKLDMMKQYEEAFHEEQFSMDLVFVESKRSRRKHVPIDCTGNAAVRQGIVEITKQHLVLPDPGMHSNFIKMGFSDAATTFALQRSQNAPNIALDLLHSSVMSTCFGQVNKMSSQDSRPALQSYSSSTYLVKQNPSSDTRPAARRQTTEEIAALQSQRSRYTTLSASNANTTCKVCKDDDYVMRPQVVQCSGPCGNSFHTTCVGLKRIPFGLTTLSDRTNHAVYVKKYFSAWVCDSCAALRSPPQEPIHALTPPPSISLSNVNNSTSKREMTRNPATSDDTAVPEEGSDKKIDKLKEFLAISGVSVDDLLKAATTAHLTISPPGSTIETPKRLEVSSSTQVNSKSASAHSLRKSFSAQENPQDSSPKKNTSVQQSKSHLALTRQDSPPRTLQQPQTSTTNPSSVVSELGLNEPVVGTTSQRVTEVETKTTQKVAVAASDPKATLLAQIAARSKATLSNSSIQGEGVSSLQGNPNELKIAERDTSAEIASSSVNKDGAETSALASSQSSTTMKSDSEATGAPTRVMLKDMREFSNYFNMLRIGCPQAAVRQKMMMDGTDPTVLELGPEAIFDDVKDRIKVSSTCETSTLQDDIRSVTSHKSTTKPHQEEQPVSQEEKELGRDVALKDHEQYSKYFKMLKMGLPEDAVRHKIKQDGLDIRALELGGEALISMLNAKPTEIRLGDDPLYSKYFKMIKMGLSNDVVQHKMQMEGADVRALILGPDAFVSELTAKKASSKSVTDSPPAKVRRKKLHWQPISNDRLSSVNRQTIWEDKGDEGVKFDVDIAEIESLFFASSDLAKKKTSVNQSKALKRKQRVTLIDGKRAMNAGISLARIKLSYSEIGHAISVFDPSGLTIEQLRGIREFLPTSEEVALVKEYGGDVAALGDAEKFILEISKVKRYVVRTECLLFRVSFPPRYDDLNVSLDNIIVACKQVKESRLLKVLLSMVLKLGNTLNGGGEDNEIRGFTVDSLLRLGHAKAVNQKTTVLHYLVRLVKKNHPAVLDFHEEINNVQLAARESFEAIDEDFGKLQSGLTQLSEEFQELHKDRSDEFAHQTESSMREVVELFGSQMENLESSIKRARDEVQGVLEYFGEDPAKDSSEFFTTLSSFCSIFESARKEVDAADEAALRAERMKLRRNVSMRASSGPASATGGLTVTRERAMSDRIILSERERVIPPRMSRDDA